MHNANGIVVDTIPAELRKRNQWVCWRLEERNGKPDKPPYIAGTNSHASSNRPKTWRSFPTAVEAYRRGSYSGIGYVLRKADCRVGIDLDACRNPATGELTPWAAEIVSLLGSYTEVSPSGYGVKIICGGTLPAELDRNKFIPKDGPTYGPKEPEIAIYDDVRYFAITGQVFGDHNTITERQEQIDDLVGRYFTEQKQATSPNVDREHASDALAVAVERMLQIRMKDGSDGSRRLFTYCCRCVEAGLSESDSLTAIHILGRLRPFPREWSDDEIRHRLKDAEREVARGSKRPAVPTQVKKPSLIVAAYGLFPTDALPRIVRKFVEEQATAIGCDPAFIALPTLACLARVIGNKRVIRLKQTWDEPAILWCAIVGKSGTHKSPALGAATALLAQKQAEAIDQFNEEMVQYERDRAQYDREYSHWKRRKGNDQPPWEPKVPECQRYIVSDITVEALAERLSCQSDGVLLVRDELAGFLDGMAEYKGGRGSDTGHWLAMWSSAPMTVDRKTSGKKFIHIPRASVSIVGGIQLGVLRRAIGREHMQDGLCARLLFAMPERRLVEWKDDVISPSTYAAIEDLFSQLLALGPAADAQGKPTPLPLTLTPAAKEQWISYYNRHRAEQVDLDDDLASAWSKLEAYAARFALLWQLANNPDATVIEEEAVLAGIKLSEWFAGEARRVYAAMVEDDDDRDRRELIEWIRRRGGRVSVRELQQNRRGYPTAEDAEAELMALIEAGNGDWEPVPTTSLGGRPSRLFRLTPAATEHETTFDSEKDEGSVDVDSDDEPID